MQQRLKKENIMAILLMKGKKKEKWKKQWHKNLKQSNSVVVVKLALSNLYRKIPSKQDGYYFEEYNLWWYPPHGDFGFGDPRRHKIQDRIVCIALDTLGSFGKIVKIKDQIWICRNGGFTVEVPRKRKLFWDFLDDNNIKHLFIKRKGVPLLNVNQHLSKICQVNLNSQDEMFKQLVAYVETVLCFRKSLNKLN